MQHKGRDFRYEAHLRLIGRHLDVNELRELMLFETEGGFILRVLNSRERRLEALEFPFEEAESLHQRARASRGRGERVQHVAPLYPTGYEDMLRALGSEFDLRAATNIVVLEMEERLIVKGLEHRESFHASEYGEFERELLPVDVQQMLDNAFRRRGN